MVNNIIINCPNCGKECNALEAHYCKNCGLQLNPGDFE